MKILFLDESSDHNLTVIDANYPLFVLGGVIVDKDYATGPLVEAVDQFKCEMFGRKDIVLHTADIVRNRNGFEGLKDAEFRSHFYDELNFLMQKLPFEVVACVIRKKDYFERYGSNAIDPYRLGLHVMAELLCDSVRSVSGRGTIIVEKRGEALDRDVENTWRILRARGSRYAKADVIRESIESFALRDKKDNIAGLQLADLVVSPIGRHMLGKPDRDDWQIVEAKFRRSPDGHTCNYGLFVFPKQQGQPPLRRSWPYLSYTWERRVASATQLPTHTSILCGD